jgi:hypothetical protein
MRRFPLPLVALASCGGALDIPPPADLPERVWFRDDTGSFNRDWYVALRDGRVWVKPNLDSGEREPGDWELLGDSGVPEGSGLVRSDPPTELVAISVDGTWIHGISPEGVIYRGSDMRRGLGGGFSWTDRWGWPAARGPGLALEEDAGRGWSVSDSHPFDVDHYEDIFGQEHSVGLGVGHVYRVSPDGTRVHWNDWWLPADWSRQLCTPERGGLRVLALSASASTLFALTEDGSLWTRLWDFDTSGENDLLTYSYLEESVSSSVRGLPAEPWRRQPVIPEGRATDRITIFQDGEGNGARVLRVEGSLDGALGLFEKRIDEEAWRFVETGQPLRGRSLDERGMEGAGLPEPEARGLILEGSLGRQDSGAELGLTLDGYDLFCSPAEVGLSWAGRPLTVDGEPLRLELHHAHAMLEEQRDQDWWRRGEAAPVRAALMVPDTIAVVDDPEAREAALELLGDRAVINLRGEAWAEGLDLEEIPRGDLFHVPRSEKGEQGSLFLLEAGGES